MNPILKIFILFSGSPGGTWKQQQQQNNERGGRRSLHIWGSGRSNCSNVESEMDNIVVKLSLYTAEGRDVFAFGEWMHPDSLPYRIGLENLIPS